MAPIRCGPLVLMAASGFAGLGYQIVWTRQIAPWVGTDASAVLAVVAAFFGGLAIGAFTFGSPIERSRNPARWYVACECAIGLWAIVLAAAVEPFGALVMEGIGADASPIRQGIGVFLSTFILFLPATTAMGATLPAFERAMASADGPHRSLAAAYAFNTGGAVLGVVCTTFCLIPWVGLARTAVLCAAINLTCAGLACFVLPRNEERPGVAAVETDRSHGILARLWVTGLLGIGYEVLVVRVLSQVTEDTVYTFALLLAVYLTGTTIGTAMYRRLRPTLDDLRSTSEWLTVLLAAACLIGIGTLWFSERMRDALTQWLPSGFVAAVSIEALLAMVTFAIPTLAMGMLFAALCDRVVACGSTFGRAIGFNTFGAACAPGFFGVLLVPAIGPKTALLLVALGYLATTFPYLISRPGPRAAVATTMLACGVLVVATPPLAFVDVPAGGHVVKYEDGISASVSVVEDAGGVDRLRIDNRQQEGTSATTFVDGRQALLPLMFHPAPHRALFLGVGTGVTASIAAMSPELDVDAVELLPEVIEASRHFIDLLTEGVPNPRLHVVAADARRYVRATRKTFDVIVADNFHPARSGSAALYTVEHFAAIRARLNADGVFCQWLPLHQLDLPTLRSIVGSFVVAFPDAFAILASNSLDTPVIGLVARRAANRIDPSVIRERVARSTMPALKSFGIDDEFSVLGSMVAGPKSLARFGAGSPVNRDDYPIVAYLAPRATYAAEAPPRRRLTEWLTESDVEVGEVVDSRRNPDIAARLSAYRSARDRFIAVGNDVSPTNDLAEMLAQVRAPLLSVLQISPDFRPAYDPLLRMATALRPIDPASAEELLSELARLQPARAEAGSLLRDLSPSSRDNGAPIQNRNGAK